MRAKKADLNAWILDRGGKAAAVFLALVLLAGCQGLSAGGKTQNPAPQQNDPPSSLGFESLTLDFGSVSIGATKTLTLKATNSGSSDITVSSVSLSVSQFTLTQPAIPITIAAGQSSTFSVQFSPAASGSISGSMTVKSDASNSTVAVALQGAGVGSGQLNDSQTSLNFGSVQDGSQQTLPVTLTNTGNSSATISQASATGTGFSINGLTLPLTLAVGQSTSFNVVFAPQSSGTVNGNVAIVSDAVNSPLNLPLQGDGLPAGSLVANPPSVTFNNVQVGDHQSVSETLSNTGGSSVTITQAQTTGAGFSISGLNLPVTLTAGQSTSFNVVFTPQSAGSVSGNIAITSNASNPTLNIPLDGSAVEPGTLSPNPSSINFGNVQVGHQKSVSETVTNTGGEDVHISKAQATGSGFSISGINPPLTLTAGQSVTFNVIFSPSSTGSASGKVTITSDASNPSLNIQLSGNGTPAGTLAVSPTSLSFGNVQVGQNSQKTAQLQASGATVTVSSVNVNNGEFSVSGLSFPVTIQAGQNVQFTVTFAPQSTGATSGTASFTSDASNSPTVLSLSGTGIQPTQHSVALSWTASISPNISGYNVYRGTTSGGPYSKINTSLDAGTSYTDNSVSGGTTYYYVTTAVDDNSQESSYSNQAQAVIP